MNNLHSFKMKADNLMMELCNAVEWDSKGNYWPPRKASYSLFYQNMASLVSNICFLCVKFIKKTQPKRSALSITAFFQNKNISSLKKIVKNSGALWSVYQFHYWFLILLVGNKAVQNWEYLNNLLYSVCTGLPVFLCPLSLLNRIWNFQGQESYIAKPLMYSQVLQNNTRIVSQWLHL